MYGVRTGRPEGPGIVYPGRKKKDGFAYGQVDCLRSGRIHGILDFRSGTPRRLAERKILSGGHGIDGPRNRPENDRDREARIIAQMKKESFQI